MFLKKAFLTTIAICSIALCSSYSLAVCPTSESESYKPFRPQVLVAAPGFGVMQNLLNDNEPIVVDGNSGPYTIEVDLNQRFSKVDRASLKLVFEGDILGSDNGDEYEKLTFENVRGECFTIAYPVEVPYEENGEVVTSFQEYTFKDTFLSEDILDGKLNISLTVQGSVKISEIHLDVEGIMWIDYDSMFGFESSASIEGIMLGEISKPQPIIPLIEIPRATNGPTEVTVASFIENKGDRERKFRQWGILSYVQRDNTLPPLAFTGFAATTSYVDEQNLMNYGHILTFEHDYPDGVYNYAHYVQQIDSGEVKVYKAGLVLSQ